MYKNLIRLYAVCYMNVQWASPELTFVLEGWSCLHTVLNTADNILNKIAEYLTH